MKVFADAVGLRMSGLCFRMFNAAHAEEKLVVVLFHPTAGRPYLAPRKMAGLCH